MCLTESRPSAGKMWCQQSGKECQPNDEGSFSQQRGLMLPNDSINNTEIDIIDHMDWVKLRLLGRGTYGQVFLSANKRNGALFAVKSIHDLRAKPQIAQLVLSASWHTIH